MSGTRDELWRLQRLAQFAPRFRDVDAEFGTWAPSRGKGTPDEPQTLPWYKFSELGDAFHRTANDAGWVVAGFDWPAWSQTREAEHLLHDPAAVAAATIADLEKLITTLVRKERFSEGTLAWAFERGLLRAIVERAEALASGGP
jgi:hypothetical protein